MFRARRAQCLLGGNGLGSQCTTFRIACRGGAREIERFRGLGDARGEIIEIELLVLRALIKRGRLFRIKAVATGTFHRTH